jgi:parallel beta-helix repeat protein
MRPRVVLLGSLLFLLLASGAQGGTYYAAPNGSGNCNSPSSPCTIATGLTRLAGTGDTLFLRGGLYHEIIDRRTYPSGSSWADARPGGSVVWIGGYTPDGGATYEEPILEGVDTRGILDMVGASYVVFDHLHIRGTRWDCPGMIGADASPARLQYSEVEQQGMGACSNAPSPDAFGGCQIIPRHFDFEGPPQGVPEFLHNNIHHSPCCYGFYVQGQFETGILIEDNDIHDHGWYGFQSFHGTEPIHDGHTFKIFLRNNRIHDNGHAITGCSMTLNYCDGCEITNNLLYGNACGMVISRHSANSLIANNTFYNNPGNWAIETDDVPPGAQNLTIRNNIIVSSGNVMLADRFGTPSSTGITQDHNLFNVSPSLFVNPGANPPDLHLQASASSAIDQGICLAQVHTDFEGHTRPSGANCDIGAYEFGSGPPIPDPTSHTYYAAPNGSGSTCSLGSPCTIVTGLSKLVGAGDTLFLRGGTYHESIWRRTFPSGSSWVDARPGGSVVWIGAYTPDGGATYEEPILQGFDATQYAPVVEMVGANYVVFDHLHIRGVSWNTDSLVGADAFAIRLQYSEVEQQGLGSCANRPGGLCLSGSCPDVAGCQIIPRHFDSEGAVQGVPEFLHNNIHHSPCCYAFYIQGQFESGVLIEDNDMHHHGWYGLQSFHGTEPIHDGHTFKIFLRKNRIHDNGHDINIQTGNAAFGCAMTLNYCDGCELTNNVIYGNACGIVLSRHSANNLIANNTLYNNNHDSGGWAIEIDDVPPGAQNLTIRNNIMVSSGAVMVADRFGTPGTNYTADHNLFNVNPPFVNSGATPPDLHLAASATATAIDQGVCLAQVPTDIEGHTRPNGANCDIGAYEFGSGTIVPPTATNLRFGAQPQTTPANTPLPPVVVDITDTSGNLVSSFTGNVTIQLVSGMTTIPKTGWTVPYVDSFEASASQQGLDYRGERAIDGNPNLVWVTQYNGGSPGYPHELQLNMQQVYTISGFRYLPPQTISESRIGQYELYTSLTGGGACTSWGAPAATGTWIDSAVEKEVLFTPRTAQYVCLHSLSSVVSGQPYASAAELNVLQGSGSGTGTLHGTLTRAVVAGHATFDDLSVDAGGTYSLLATATGLTSATSTPFTSTVAASHLQFVAQPTTVLIGQTFPPVTVQFLDGVGNVITTTQGVNLVLNGCGNALGGTVARAAVSGLATFNDLSISTAGANCTLVASATGMVDATSQVFSVLTNPFVTGEWLADAVSAHYCAQTGGDTNLSGSTPGVDHVHTLGCALPANLLQGGALLQSCALIDMATAGTGSRPLFKLLVGGQIVAAHALAGTNTTITSNQWVCFTSVVAQNSGPAVGPVPVYTSFDLEPPSFPQYTSLPNQIAQPVNLNTAAALPLAFASQWPTAGSGTNSITLHGMIVGLAY